MRRIGCIVAAALLAALGAACSDATTGEPGLGARVTLDRVEASVGDPIGVTVEIETPAGWRIETPPAPGDGAFASDAVELVAPVANAGGLRHHLLWTLRAREVGELTLPWLEVPVVRADGAAQPLRVGGVPLSVRSVRAELPSREAVFDIRSAPPDLPTPIWVWALVAAGIALAVWGARAIRRRARAARAVSGALASAGGTALAALDAAEQSADPRGFASGVRDALVPFVSRVWGVDATIATPDELERPVDAELVRILREVELARFAKRPALAPLRPLVPQARDRIRHVAHLRG